jgi:thiol-activated cytolysin
MKQYVYLLILPIMFLISCSDDTVEETGSSNHVLLERYPQEVINISMDR